MIYQPHYTKTLDEYKNLEQTLIDEKEKQIAIISQVQGRWKGQAAETYTALYQEFLTKGEYFRAQFINSREIEIMDGELGNINRLMARCEQLDRQLLQDEYVAPVLPADGDDTIYNDGYLTMDYDYIPYVNTAIDNALQSADEGRDILLEAAEICSEVMDMSEYTGMIHKADRKIHRLENYKREFNEYADGVSALEERMGHKFGALKDEYEQMKNPAWSRIVEQLNDTDLNTNKLMTRVPQILKATNSKETTYTIDLDINALQQIGYTYEEIEQQFAAMDSDTDKEFWHKILQGKYREAFTSTPDPDVLNANTKELLAVYVIKLYEKDKAEYDKNGKMVSLEQFINEMIDTDSRNCINTGYDPEAYVQTIEEALFVYREVFTADLFTGKQVGNDAREKSMDISDMCSLWYALADEWKRGDILLDDGGISTYPYGGMYLKVSEIEYNSNSGAISLVIDLYNTQYRNDPQYKDFSYNNRVISSIVAWTPQSTDIAFGNEQIRIEKKKLDDVWQSSLKAAMNSILYAYCSQAVNWWNIGEGILMASLSKVILGLSNLTDDSDKKASGRAISSIISYVESRKQQHKSYDEEVKRNMLKWFYSTSAYTELFFEEGGSVANYNGNTLYYYEGDGIYNYGVIQGIRKWDEQGIGSFLDPDNECIEQMLMDKALDNNEDNCLRRLNKDEVGAVLYMIYGQDNIEKGYKDCDDSGIKYTKYDHLMSIDNDVFLKAVDALNDYYNSTNPDKRHINEIWQDYIEGINGD